MLGGLRRNIAGKVQFSKSMNTCTVDDTEKVQKQAICKIFSVLFMFSGTSGPKRSRSAYDRLGKWEGYAENRRFDWSGVILVALVAVAVDDRNAASFQGAADARAVPPRPSEARCPAGSAARRHRVAT